MKQQYLFAIWGGLFVLCAALGFIPNPSASLQILMTLLSVAFFIPAALLLRRSHLGGDRTIAMLVRNLSVASLALTALLIMANFFSVLAPRWLGDGLHAMLVIVSSPMVCSGYWALSLFLWACLMVCSTRILKAKKNS